MSERVEHSVHDSENKTVRLGPRTIRIPEDWDAVAFEEAVELNPRYTKPNQGPFDYLPMDAVDEKKQTIEYWTKRAKDDCTTTWFKNGDTVYAKITPCTENGKIAFVQGLSTEVGSGSTEFLVLHPREGVTDERFVFYLSNLPDFRSVTISLMEGSTGRQRVPSDIFKRGTEVPLPPIDEQRRIADILSTVDEQIQQTDETIQRTKELKTGLRQDLITGGIGHDNYKNFQIGPFEYEIPQSWNVTTVAQCAENRDSERIPVKSSKREDMDGEIPYYGASGCIDYVDDYLFDGTFLLISEDGKNLLRRTRPIAFKITGKAWVNNHVHILKPNEDMSLEYLLNYFEILKYDPFVTGMDQIKLNQTNLNRIKVPKPSLEEQEKIAEILRSVTQKIKREKSRLEKLEELKDGLMQDLLTGEIRVSTD